MTAISRTGFAQSAGAFTAAGNITNNEVTLGVSQS
jgi:hypothetical protein